MCRVNPSHQPCGDVAQQSRFLILCEPRTDVRILADLCPPVCDLPVIDGVQAARGVQETGHGVQGLIGAEAGVSSLQEGDDKIVAPVAP